MTGTVSRRSAFLAVIGVVMTLSQAAFGQVSLTPDWAPFLTTDQLIAVVGTDSAAAAIVSQALAYHVQMSPNKTTSVIGSQIPEHWLPSIPEVRFARLTDDEARTHLQQCSKLRFVSYFKLVTPDVATMSVGEVGQCFRSVLDLHFKRSADGWHLETGFGGGGSGGGHCACS